ncbi:hypothetical protein, partial [Sphingorhabdus sp.]|uniref:hypothetical protein n=2 Tax=Sphingorhabdus sp. TaxID=1902408 RepID=UPI003BB10D33
TDTDQSLLASCGKRPQKGAMLNILAFLFGLIALVLALPAMIPLLGWMNWIIIIIAGVGVAFGFASDKNSGRNFCLVVVAICAIRLWIGGGLI